MNDTTGKDTRDSMETLKHDTQDTLDEAKQRAQAAGEHIKRDVRGDSMPLGERIASNVSELTHKGAAELDKASRESRHAGDDRPA